jgi:acetylornithine deacetylase/succinyl-diaminopimelate desuccinylase-like protein
VDFTQEQLYNKAIDLLKKLIATSSFSREEDKTASILEGFFHDHRIETHRRGNNVWAKNRFFDPAKETILLNSHHDTVKPNPGYTKDPFSPGVEDGKLFGLGSNDAGGPLVALLATFLYFFDRPDLKYNLVLAASAEEEISGFNGIESIWNELPKIDFAIVGEPTLTDMAIAEKGLMVLDCVSKGKAGHAAREEGVNAIYEAIKDIEWFKSYQFPKVSAVLGKIKMSVTIIQAGQAHNQVPSECRFTVDVRITDDYTLEEVLEVIKQHVKCSVTPRSMRFRSSGIASDHVLVKAGTRLGMNMYGSPTTSDQALIPASSVKIGPGDSARSHTADEFIYLEDVRKGISTYIKLIEECLILNK